MKRKLTLSEFVRRQIVAQRKNKPRKKFGRPPAWLYPMAIEIRYRVWLVQYVDKLKELIKQELLRFVPGLLLEADQEHHHDAWPKNLSALMDKLEQSFDTMTNDPQIKAYLTNIGQKTSEWNDSQWQKTLSTVLGVDVYRPESFLGSHIESFVNQNTSLITDINKSVLTDVRRVVETGVRQGERHEDISRQILSETDIGPGVFDKVETRARLIARDQVAKLNGELTEIRQKNLGINKYIWRTAQDDRVRDAHASLDGMMCRYDDDTVYSDDGGETWQKRTSEMFIGTPGQDYQCRCYAEAVFDEDMAEEVSPDEEPEEVVNVPEE
jgi:SPP1 gp7 family putative phage head morphogenesis protein